MDDTPTELDSDSRRRYLTVVFADLCGSTARSLSMDEEVYADLLNGVRQIAREVVPRHGGVVVRTQGDGIVAIFGYPAAGEDDGRRAVAATLELHARVRLLDAAAGGPGHPHPHPHQQQQQHHHQQAQQPPQQPPIALHSGIHAGRVLLRPGYLEGALFELIGPVPNLAAHLSALAGWDDVLVSEQTLGPQQRHFILGETLTLDLPGRPSPLPAVRVMGLRMSSRDSSAAPALPARAPLAGRQVQLQALARQLSAASAGRAQFVAVTGDAGLGKTRLVEGFLQRAAGEGHAVHRGYCERDLSAAPLQPFLQILRSLAGITPQQAPLDAVEAVEAFVSKLGPAVEHVGADLLQVLSLSANDPEARRPGAEQQAALLRAVFTPLCARGLQIVFLDDWHWSDDASRQALAALLTLDQPLLVVVTARPVPAADPLLRGAEVLALEPLGLEAATSAIDALLPGTDPFVAADIHRYAGGNPLFIEELCHMARTEGGALRLDRAHLGSAWLNTLIESRFSRLREDQADLVRCAAVIGNVVPAWLLERLTGIGESDPRLLALADQDLVFPADQAGLLRFKHGLARDVIYESVGLRDKTALHLRIAQAFTAQASERGQAPEDLYEALAYHYGAAAQPREAARYAELAGDKALAVSALDRARAQYLAALQALDRDGLVTREDRQRWIAIVHRLGMACVFDPLGLEDGLHLFERAVELAGDLNDLTILARTEYWLTYIAYAKGDVRYAIRHGQHALELAEAGGDVRLAAQVRAALGQAYAAAADYPRALPLLERAVDVKRRQVQSGSSLAIGSAYSLATKALVLGDRGEFDAALESFDLALDMVRGTGHQVESSVLGWYTTVLMWRGCWSEAIDSSARSSAIAASCKSTHLYAMHLAQSAYAQCILTRRPEALRTLKDATAWIEARNGKLVISLNHGWLSDVLVAEGLLSQVRIQAARALWRGRALDRVGEAMACRAMARAVARTVARGNSDAAQSGRWLDRARLAAQARSSAHEAACNDLCEAEILASAGERSRAALVVERASTAFERMGMRWHLGRARLLAESL